MRLLREGLAMTRLFLVSSLNYDCGATRITSRNDRVQLVTQNEYVPAYRQAGLREIASRRARNDTPLFSFDIGL